MALLGNDSSLDTMRYQFNSSKANITIQWIPENCGIVGNEAADAAPKSAAKIPGPAHPISYNSACTTIKKLLRIPQTLTLVPVKCTPPSREIKKD